MCLGIPGLVVEMVDDNDHLARIDVAGVRRTINIGLLEGEGLAIGDWVLIHVGFAMAIIDEVEAQRAMEGLELMGQAYEEELEAVRASRIEPQLEGIAESAGLGGSAGIVGSVGIAGTFR